MSIPIMQAFPPKFRKKLLIVFDLDGTLTPSKAAMPRDMAILLRRLLERKQVAVIGGGRYEQFQNQFIRRFTAPRKYLVNLFLFPTNSMAFYHYTRGAWREVYAHRLTRGEKKRILGAFAQMFQELHYKHPLRTYGDIVEDRGTQISFSPLGQDVVQRFGMRGVRMKEEWKKKHNLLRLRMRARLARHLPQFTVRVGGITTIDVTRKGIDKGYGIRQIQKYLHVPMRNMLFVGDAIYPGGNDYAVTKTSVDYMKVRGPEETKRLIRKILRT